MKRVRESRDPMLKTLPLKILMEAIEMVDSTNQVVIHQETLEIFVVDDMSLDCLNRYDQNPTDLLDWEYKTAQIMADIQYENPENYLQLPTRYELNDYLIMAHFIETLPRGLQDVFFSSIRKKGAFSHFDALLIKHHLREDFFDFKRLEYQKILIQWCQNLGFNYE